MISGDHEIVCDPIGDGTEVLKPAVSPGSSACELKEAVDGLDGCGRGVVPEAAEGAFEMMFKASISSRSERGVKRKEA